MKNNDTIAAIATAMSNSGIGIIRISGEQAFCVAEKIIRIGRKREKVKPAGRAMHYGFIYDKEEVVDEVMVLWMKGPGSYTAEDTVEIDCHGGIMMMRRILDIVLKNGARAAEPGEFTKRAFLNGRIDLSQAEAVMDVIRAKNEYALKSSVAQLGGRVSERVRTLREGIIHHIAYIESALDDPEHISLEGYGENLRKDTVQFIGQIEKLLSHADDGRIMKEGIKTVILGRPNAGKSSLMNVLLGEERAIVTEVEGTTRDTLEESIDLSGITLNIVDTAGIRDTEDVVEKIGVEKARKMAEDADLIIYVADGSSPLNENDREITEMIRDKKAVVLLNKSDLSQVISPEELSRATGLDVIRISAKNRIGLEELEEKIKSMFYHGKVDFNDQIYITAARHKLALTEAETSLKMVLKSIDEKMPEDFYSIDLMNAYEELGSIIGESVEDDLVDEIFSKFCMGK